MMRTVGVRDVSGNLKIGQYDDRVSKQQLENMYRWRRYQIAVRDNDPCTDEIKRLLSNATPLAVDYKSLNEY